MENTKKRIYYLDILRILSILGVLFIHATAQNIEKIDFLGSTNWWIAACINAGVRWAVPVFFMISGALLISRQEESLEDFFKKRFLRIGIPFLIWSIIYSILKHYYYAPDYPWPYEMLWIIPKEILFDKVYYHFWFVYVIFAVYLVIPIVQSLIKSISEKKLKYFITLWFFVSIVYTGIQSVYKHYTGEILYISLLNIPWFMGYIGYFIIGYYISTRELKKRNRFIIYILGIISLILTPIVTYYLSVGQTVINDEFLGHFSITTFFMSVAVFTLFKNMKLQEKINVRLGKLIASISGATFGIYLIHSLVQLTIINYVSMDITQEPLILIAMYCLSSILGFVISYVIVKILSLNKVVKKLLVG